VLQALRSYPGNIALQQVGLWTLGSLAANHRENGNKIGKKGGISLVINAMKAFSDIPSLQEMVLSFVLLFFVACEYVYTRRTYV
jgi:hypothetical protein